AGAMALAFTALFCVLRRRAPAAAASADGRAWLWPLGVWLAYGIVDVLFKQVAKTGAAFPGALLIAFALSGVFMTGYLLLRRTEWQVRHLLAGVALGAANFGNIVTTSAPTRRCPTIPRWCSRP